MTTAQSLQEKKEKIAYIQEALDTTNNVPADAKKHLKALIARMEKSLHDKKAEDSAVSQAEINALHTLFTLMEEQAGEEVASLQSEQEQLLEMLHKHNDELHAFVKELEEDLTEADAEEIRTKLKK